MTATNLRMSLRAAVPAAYSALLAFDRSIELDARLRELVKIRASQLNGCSYCVDLHTRDALAAGEEARRLLVLPVWRHTPFFDARERAALALTEAVTTIADGFPEDVYEEAAACFEPGELGEVLMAIIAVNSWNRIGVASGMAPA